jgi:exonuclease VII large subunit
MALAASVCILAVRLIDQDKQIQSLKDSESALITSLKRDNKRLMQRFDDLRDAVREEISRAGHRLPPLATRLQSLLDEKFNKDTQQQQTLPLEHPPAEEERGVAGLGMDTLQHPKKEKSNFMV